MNDIHDMGGMQGAGPVAPEKDEPVFHEQWEKSSDRYGARRTLNSEEARTAAPLASSCPCVTRRLRIHPAEVSCAA
jgi:nitrile hydratase subunit beta